jgi:hypothetical protein
MTRIGWKLPDGAVITLLLLPIVYLSFHEPPRHQIAPS